MLSPILWQVGIRLIDHITLKGGHKPFRVYADDRSNLWLKMNPRLIEIYGAEAAYEQFSKTFHEGIDAFIKGDWPTAQQAWRHHGSRPLTRRLIPRSLPRSRSLRAPLTFVRRTRPHDCS